MGYWADAANVVATAIVGPGPAAEHTAESFTPDHNWQLDQIAAQYESSGRRDLYLGDWHSHPNTAFHRLSGKDRLTLRRISRHAPARMSTPIMLLTAGTPDGWSISAWVGKPRFALGIPVWLEVGRVSVQIF
jgi:integrative and conjugative element protein (TIGR02256 family)